MKLKQIVVPFAIAALAGLSTQVIAADADAAQALFKKNDCTNAYF